MGRILLSSTTGGVLVPSAKALDLKTIRISNRAINVKERDISWLLLKQEADSKRRDNKCAAGARELESSPEQPAHIVRERGLFQK